MLIVINKNIVVINVYIQQHRGSKKVWGGQDVAIFPTGYYGCAKF